ncbi:Methyl farnesoate epoxidase [Folsomia candida]|uniref:Methyl farnesoate epoxidase n=1 Tax=Folsomia candida TaxID=158441 RepID=A0A226DGI0_FOLCA|nr:Methyl farnesoate epoxidase [Folsomia candida]
MGILAEKYGEIYSLKMGFKKTVILTSMEAMKTIFTNEAAFGRDITGMSGDRILHKNIGIASSTGKMWEKTRTWTFRTLKDFGFGKSLDMECFIKTASQSLFADIDSKIETQSGVIEIDRYFNASILAIMWKMIVGRIIPEDEPNMEAISEKGHAFMRSGVLGMGIVNAYPFLRHIFPKTLGYTVQMDYFTTCNRVGKHLFLEMENELNSSQLTSHHNSLLEKFVQNYTAGNDPELFNCENFQLIFQDLLLGSTDTSATFMEIVVLYLIVYPAVQEKVYQEILRVSPNGRDISYSDRKE